MERFDKISKPTTPTSSDDALTNTTSQVNGQTKQELKNGTKRSATPSSSGAPTPESDESVDPSPPKKKRKQPDSDAKLAAKLQAEENSRARPSRAGVTKRNVVIRKKATPKKKSSAKVKTEDDSDLDQNSDGEKKDVVRKGGFHVSI
jgi:upstream activation factor subunit UAF30